MCLYFRLSKNKSNFSACPTYEDHDILSSENDDFQITINGEEAPDGFLDALVNGKGWELKCGSTIEIHDDENGFDLLNLSFETNRPIDMVVTLEYENRTNQTTNVSKSTIHWLCKNTVICVYIYPMNAAINCQMHMVKLFQITK